MRPAKLMFILFMLASTVGSAQLKGFSFGPYVERAWPAGQAQSQLKNGLGAGISADIRLPARLALTGSAGYLHFSGRRVTDQSGTYRYDAINAVPLRAGLKFRPLPLFYFKMEAGTAKFLGEETSAFLLSPGIGLRILGIDLQGKYEKWYDGRNTSFWGVRAGLNF